MIPRTVEALLAAKSDDAVDAMLDDPGLFCVDHREEDDAIVGSCEDVLQTRDLSAEVVDIDDDPGFALYISHHGKRVRVPLVVGPEDRHITLRTLNQVLKPAYEIRVSVDSQGGDTLWFLPLSTAEWADLEKRFGAQVGKRFQKIEARPNLFTEVW